MIEELIKENEYVIYSVIKKYTNYFDKDDLYQVGAIGLLEAYKHFDDSKNTKFSSFSYFYVKGEVVKYIRESNFLKVSREMASLNKKINKIRDYLTLEKGYVPSTRELSLYLEIPEEKILEAEESCLVVESLDKELDCNTELYNFYGYEEKSYKEELIDLRNELAKLSSEDKLLIEKRYKEGLTQSEVSKDLGINQVKVSRMEKKILTRLRKGLS